MKNALVALTIACSLPAGFARAADALSVQEYWAAPTFGTLGVGVEGGYRWNPYWSARASINGGNFKYNYHDNRSDLINRLSLFSAGVTADYYPFEGDFRVSAGVRLSASEITGKMMNLEKRSKHLTVIIDDPLTRYTVRQNVIQPYLGIGYSAAVTSRLTLNFDFGALYAGTPSLSVNSHADRFGFTPRQIDNEVRRQRDRIAPFSVYPVAQIGLKFRF
jgi:hypothetical protein